MCWCMSRFVGDLIRVFVGVIKTLTALLLNSKSKFPETHVEIYSSSLDICSCFLLKTISGMHKKRFSYLGFRVTVADFYVLND